MNEGATTWALVVGIDEYESPDLRDLTGAAADAVAAVQWLRKLGVPDDHILLHAVPGPGSKGAVDSLGIPYGDAKFDTIWTSIEKLQKVTGGTRLFVFLCGHGLYEPSARRLFLTQEFGIRGYANLGIEIHGRVFLSIPGFTRQFLIMDGCLNLPYSAAERQRIKAGAPVGYDEDQVTPRPENSMLACFGAAQGQRVAEIEGRGAFMRRLMPAIDPSRPIRDAVTLDWETGQLELDMQKAVQIVGRQVEKDGLALTPVIPQTPQPTPMGLQRLDGRYPAFTLESAKPVALELRVNPDTAAPDLEYVRVWIDRPPFPMFYRPADGATEVTPPLVCKVPADTELRVDCTVREGAPWQNGTTLTRLKASQDQAVVFELIHAAGPPVPTTDAPVLPLPKAAPLPPGPPVPAVPKTAAEPGYVLNAITIIVPPYAQTGPSQDPFLGGEGQVRLPGYQSPMGWSPTPSGDTGSEAAEAHYKVRLVHPSGFGWGGLTSHYRSIERKLGLQLPWPEPLITGDNSPWYQIRRGVRIQRHEDGPEFRVDPAATVAARRLVRKWATEMREVIPADITIHTLVEDPTPAAPNLRLVFAGSPEDLAGPIAGRPTVRIGRPVPIKEPVWRSGKGQSLRDLAANPSIRVDPGPTEIRIDLPWGSWSRTVKAPAVRDAVRVRLPEQIGNPPLRVELAGARLDDGWRLMGTAGRRPVGRVLIGAEVVPLTTKRRTAGRWALGFGEDTPQAGTVELGDVSRVRFPMLRKWPLAIDWSERGLRVEPISRIDSPEWDLLVASGRLDELRPEDGVRLTEDKWFDAVLGLAGAYAVYAAADWGYLATVTKNLRRVDPIGVDVDLLAIAAQRGDRAGLSAEGAATLKRLGTEQPVPVMRWGVALALELLRAADLSATQWSRDLARMAEGLSPISTWTAWTV